MKAIQKQPVRHDNLRKFPKLSIPPGLLVLREVELLDVSERFGQVSRPHQILPQHRRD